MGRTVNASKKPPGGTGTGQTRRPGGGVSGQAFANTVSLDLKADRHYKVLIEERRRLRVHVKNMKATESQHGLLVASLRALLSDREFVRLLARQGFTTMPKLLHQHLSASADIEGIPGETADERQGTINLTNGLCLGAARILAAQSLPVLTIAAMGSMSSARQIAVAREMQDGNNYTVDFARALLAATPRDLRASGARIRKADEARAVLLAGIERSLMGLQLDTRALEQNHNSKLFFLALGGGVVRLWASNGEVKSWLRARYPRYAVFLEKLAMEADCARTAPRRAMTLSYS